MLNNISNEFESKCKICGKKLKNMSKDKCTECLRKIYATSILEELNSIGIDSELSFKKSDLEVLKYPEFKILDYIWTLQEFNLLTENNITKEFSLKDEYTINEFINQYKQYLDSDEKTEKDKKPSIVKECLLCKKTLKITEFYTSNQTEDGYSDYCKNCDSLIRTGENLSSILNFVTPNETFEIEELTPKFENDKLLVLAIIWNLLDNDLIETIEEEKIYKLKDENTVRDFLKKVSEDEDEEIIIKNEQKTQNIEDTSNLMNYFISNKTEDEFEIIVKGIVENKNLFNILKDLEIFDASLKRIVTYKIEDNETEILFELKSKIENLKIILEKLEKLNWIKK